MTSCHVTSQSCALSLSRCRLIIILLLYLNLNPKSLFTLSSYNNKWKRVKKRTLIQISPLETSFVRITNIKLYFILLSFYFLFLNLVLVLVWYYMSYISNSHKTLSLSHCHMITCYEEHHRKFQNNDISCYDSMILKLIKERNFILGLTQENSMEFLV